MSRPGLSQKSGNTIDMSKRVYTAGLLFLSSWYHLRSSKNTVALASRCDSDDDDDDGNDDDDDDDDDDEDDDDDDDEDDDDDDDDEINADTKRISSLKFDIDGNLFLNFFLKKT